MKNHPTGLAANPLRLLAAAFILLLAVATPLMAQRERNRALAEKSRGNVAALNEWRRTHMTEEVNKQFEKRRISLMPLIKEDFARLQIVNNEMMRKIFEDQVLDYRQISESISEIRKRAGRLRENLMLPVTEDVEKSPKRPAATTTGQVKDSLLVLDSLIMSFVRNPLFQQPGIVDAKHSAKAGSDLKTIIEFSGGIRKEIELLSKLTGKQ
jgi:hypothetical protein